MRWMNCVLLHGLLLIVLGFTACIGGQTGSEARGGQNLGKTEACDPLGPQPEPIELGTVLAVGRDSGGTVYVVDRKGASDYRAFVAEGTTLVRQRVAGTGEINETAGARYLITVDGSPQYNLIVEIDADRSTRMGRTERQDKSVTVASLSADERLEMLDPESIDGYAVRNLPGGIRIEYLARTPDGKLLVTLVPVDDFSYDKFRLFYGDPDALIERKLDEVTRARDGGSTHLLFHLEDVPADAFFPVEFDGTMFKPGPATLDLDGDVSDLERLDPDADADVLDDAEFACLID